MSQNENEDKSAAEKEADEKKLREHLSEQLGVEFCSEDDLNKEFEKVKEEMSSGTKAHIDPPPRVSISEIINQCNEASKKMGIKNPNRHLLFLCATALRQLVDRLDKLEQTEQKVH